MHDRQHEKSRPRAIHSNGACTDSIDDDPYHIVRQTDERQQAHLAQAQVLIQLVGLKESLVCDSELLVLSYVTINEDVEQLRDRLAREHLDGVVFNEVIELVRVCRGLRRCCSDYSPRRLSPHGIPRATSTQQYLHLLTSQLRTSVGSGLDRDDNGILLVLRQNRRVGIIHRLEQEPAVLLDHGPEVKQNNGLIACFCARLVSRVDHIDNVQALAQNMLNEHTGCWTTGRRQR